MTVLASQLGLTLVAAAVAALAGGRGAALAALLGGVVCLAGSAYGARRVFGRRAGDARSTLATLYRAEVGRLLIAAVLLALVLSVVSGAAAMVAVAAFAAVQVGGSLAALGCSARPGPTARGA